MKHIDFAPDKYGGTPFLTWEMGSTGVLPCVAQNNRNDGELVIARLTENL